MSSRQSNKNGLSVTSYAGDGAALLAFDLDEDKTRDFAGFAIKARTPTKGPYRTNEYWLKNRLSFKELTGEETLTSVERVESNKAPFQSFHWIHFPGAGPGQYTYTVYPCYFKKNSPLELDPGVSINVDLGYRTFTSLELGFTRGIVSSQSYTDWFHNADIEPKNKTVDFNTDRYQRQYEWLGAHGRKMIFDFLDECVDDPSINVDVFSYDLDEPDIIRKLASMGSRVRVVQDDSCTHSNEDKCLKQHTKESPEPYAVGMLERSGVAIKKGHFIGSRGFAHDKVMIQKKQGKATKVLTGSANFSIRGLYIQANSVLTFDDPGIAALYEEAFEQAFSDMDNFRSSRIASQWFDEKTNGSSPASFSFAPHGTSETVFTLETVSEAIDAAKSSVMFAIMQMGTSKKAESPVMSSLEVLGDRKEIFSLGSLDMKNQLKLFKKGKSMGLTSYDWLRENVQKPFREEMMGLTCDPEKVKAFCGHVIHHKFIVCDFNDLNPVVFCGSSNLAVKSETQNGDNLIAIHDPYVAEYYALEAIRLYDHYRFRSKHQHSTSNRPLMLDTTDRWAAPYYDPDDIKFYERRLYSMARAVGAVPAIEARA